MPRSVEDTATIINLFLNKNGQEQVGLSGDAMKLFSQRAQLRTSFINELQTTLINNHNLIMAEANGVFWIVRANFTGPTWTVKTDQSIIRLYDNPTEDNLKLINFDEHN